jgi:hypothetical protein
MGIEVKALAIEQWVSTVSDWNYAAPAPTCILERENMEQ